MAVSHSETQPASEAPPAPSLPKSQVGLYALPMIGVNFSFVLLIAYITKYSADVLLINAAAIGFILGAARIWDAATDPVAGYWSDRTHSRFGRRRPWLIASAVPIAVFGLMAWAPPQALTGTPLVIWMIVAIFGSSAAVTVFLVPHQALGAELSDSYHARSTIFGWRQAVATIGTMLALVGAISILTNVEDERAAAFWIAIAAGAVVVLTVIPSALGLKERADYSGRGSRSAAGTIRDVWRNPHARLLYVMVFVEHIGSGASMVLAPFLMDYVIGMREMTGIIFIPYTVAQLAIIPFWVWLSRRIGKKATWLIGMGVGVVGYTTLFFVGHHDLYLMFAVVTMTGSSSACGTVIGSSILADVIDYDEVQTGQRKEGAYYSLYNFLYKGSGGVMAMIAGATLTAVGFVPNVEQTDQVKFTISALMSFVPLACVLGGALIFLRFRLTEDVHAGIRAQLAEREASEE